MVNDLEVLLRRNVESPPPDRLDLGDVVTAGRRRVRGRRRRSVLLGSAGLAVAAIGAVAALHAPLGIGPAGVAGPPAPDAPTLHLADARDAVRGSDYRVLASYTNDNLDQANGQYFDGVTTDGQILFRDDSRLALMDPATGHKDWLPRRPRAQHQAWVVQLGTHRLVLITEAGFSQSSDGSMDIKIAADVFDRTPVSGADEWPICPPRLPGVVMGPDHRLYVRVLATQGRPPRRRLADGPDGEAEDAAPPATPTSSGRSRRPTRPTSVTRG